MPPYLPFLEALGTYVRASQAEVLLHQLGTTPRLLAGLLPEIELKLKRLPMGPQLAPEQARLRLFDAVADFLRAIADARPAVLLLDDLQWAGTAILDLLVHVARRSRSSRADPRRLSARRRCSQRGGPADAGRTRPPAIARRNAGYSTLSESETRDLGEGFRRASVHDNLAAALWRHSEGNPFVAEELLRGWLDAGQVRNNAGV